MALVYYGEQLAAYGFGEGHPFGPDRLDAFWNEVNRRHLDEWLDIAPPVNAVRDDLLRFHTTDYIDRLEQQSASGTGYLDLGDTPAFRGIYEASLTVAGCVLDGAQRIMSAETRHVFVPIAGLHHARRDGAAGFCAINDIGTLVETLLEVKTIQVPAEFQRNARSFLYYQLYRTSLPLNEYLEPAARMGFVNLQPFSWRQLLPENSRTMRVIQDGILREKPFLLPEL